MAALAFPPPLSSVTVAVLKLVSGSHTLFVGLVSGSNGLQVGILSLETGCLYDRLVVDGRLTAKDPIQFRENDTNLYGYVFNDPPNGLDLYREFWGQVLH